MPTSRPKRYTTGSLPIDRKSTRLNSSHTVIYTLSLHDALPIYDPFLKLRYYYQAQRLLHYGHAYEQAKAVYDRFIADRSEEHTSELQSHSDLHSFPTRRSSDLRPFLKTALLLPGATLAALRACLRAGQSGIRQVHCR